MSAGSRALILAQLGTAAVGGAILFAAGVLAGAALWDVAGSSRRWPWWTTTTALGFFALRWFPQPLWLHGVVTIAFFLAAVVLVARRT